MPEFDEQKFSGFFRSVTGHDPFPYQQRVAEAVISGRNVALRAPTGAGKTWAVLIPFLYPEWRMRPSRLIYALPLRTLAQGIYRECCEMVGTLSFPLNQHEAAPDQEIVSPAVTMQTGEQPDDPFFDRGRIVVTTYDQVLSGLLDAPYGLSDRLHNINAAAVAGSLVVFDEFHLMEPQRAFLTAAAGLHSFRDLCQSVWMTATATRPLENVLQEALGTVSVPETETELERLLDSLPSVTEVTRHIAMESEPLSAESVLRCQGGRSLVLLNTVGRAQAMFAALRRHLEAERSNIPLVLLHSRFFREDRRAKENRLRSLFGKGVKGPAILVATQVVEAGIDISCDHLHTELCPMNALVQRAGRCARFAGEAGTVHVHPLPSEERAWLPYGSLGHEDATLTGTRELLERVGRASLHPRQAAKWVQQVHGADDDQALREGWRSRLITCLRRIEQNAILRDPKRVADLIRGEDTDSIRVIINEEARRPDVPGKREGLSLSRWTIARLFRNGASDIGWFWDGSDSEPWKPLRAAEDLKRTYVVCLRPILAAYDGEVGLRLGTAGTQESPSRVEPKRPGYAPLKAEAWSDHVRRVADEAKRRLERERLDYGLLGSGFEKRYGLSPQAFREGLVACALLHDLGKLQVGWQRWAEAAQRARDPGYRHVVPLAHTDFDPDKPEDRERELSLGIRRPAHAPAGAFYSGALLARLLSSAPEEERTRFASACTAAILAHHGGWLPEYLDLGISGFWDGWEQSLADVLGWVPQTFVLHLQKLQSHKDKRGAAQVLLNVTTNPENLAEYWPLVAYLTRTLRLSDQRATAEGASHE